jgi:heme O synthase-like polyprenyltransferase
MDWNSCSINGVAQITCIFPLIATFIYWGLMFGGSVSVIFIIVGGIRFVISSGDAKQLDQARKTVLYAVLGLFLIFSAFLIINIIAGITGVGCITPNTVFSGNPFQTCQ